MDGGGSSPASPAGVSGECKWNNDTELTISAVSAPAIS